MSQWKNLADALLTNHLRLISSSVIRHIDISSVQLLSSVRLFATPWTAAHQASLSITNSWSLLKFMSIKLVMPSNHLILFHPPSSCLQSFPASGSFQMSQFFAWGGQSIGVSASALVLPMNIQDWFPLGLTGWISLQLTLPAVDIVIMYPLYDGYSVLWWYSGQNYVS